MHLYWRIQNDLDAIGNLLIMNHPSLNREFQKWVKRNAEGLAVAEDLTWGFMQSAGCNLN